MYVNNIAHLRTLSKTTNKIAVTLGYYTPGDRGHGTYWYDPNSDSASDDGGSIIVANDGGRWRLITDGTINVRQFGAKGDGNTDDTQVLQQLFNNINFRNVYFPVGSYRITNNIIITHAKTIFGDTQLNTSILIDHSGVGFRIVNINTYGLYIYNMAFTGLGAGVGMQIDATLEESAHMRLSNLRFASLVDGIQTNINNTFAMFDSYMDKVDFILCSGIAFVLAGSQNTIVGCTFRACGHGIQLKGNTGGKGGGALHGCTFILNDYDVVVNTTNVRLLSFNSCWFEQTKNLSVGKLTGGSEILFNVMTFQNCLFQPGATSLGNGTVDGFDYKGCITFENIIVYRDLFAAADLPAETVGDSNSIVCRRNCVRLASGGTITFAKDYTTNDSVNFKKLYDNKKFANDAAAGVGGLTIGDVYYNTTSGMVSIKN